MTAEEIAEALASARPDNTPAGLRSDGWFLWASVVHAFVRAWPVDDKLDVDRFLRTAGVK